MNWLRTATQYLIPTLCMVCEQPQAEIVCYPCRDRIAQNRLRLGPSCLICALPIRPHQSLCAQCDQEKPAFDRVTYLDLYRDPLRHPLHLLKYQKRLACANGFALLWNIFHHHTVKACNADVLIPVPLSPTKLATRGFNQAWEIAKRFDLPKSVRCIPNAITCQATIAQASLNRAERTTSMQDRFVLKEAAATMIRGQHILIVDDVMTTGSTFHSLATTLKHSGAKQVSAWAIFRTPPWKT
jgi:ComF family protein